jgi:hypothetical protein
MYASKSAVGYTCRCDHLPPSVSTKMAFAMGYWLPVELKESIIWTAWITFVLQRYQIHPECSPTFFLCSSRLCSPVS